MRFSQYLPDLVPHDAISDHARRLHEVLVGAGHDSSIHAAHVDHRLRREAQRWSARSPAPEGVAIYHASTGSPLAGWLRGHAAAGTPLVVDYHNITPARYFDRWDAAAAARCRAGRAELASLATCAVAGVADSEFNEAELLDAGYPTTATCPLLVDLDSFRDPVEPGEPQALRRRATRIAGAGAARSGSPEPPGTSWLFVGRLAPNKCQHDLVAAFAVYRRLHDPAARLELVGSTSSILYRRALGDLCAELGVDGAVSLVGSATHTELLARFRSAGVLVCLSEHEGFCVPLLEAMVVGTPVVAFAAAAVPETLAGAGVLLDDKDPLVVAEAVAGLMADRRRRERLVEAGRQRAATFEMRLSAKRWLRELELLG
ncbi:MAG: glycosyltransferase [Actinomycetota bacterium]|nr:glycosyltransferase [Actinomycetota bacterium]